MDNGFRTGGKEPEPHLKKQVIIDKIKQQAEVIRENMIEKLDNSLNSMVNEIENLDAVKEKNDKINNVVADETKSTKKFADKQFIARNSLLTDMFEVNHFRTIHHIFAAILLILIMNEALNSYFNTGSITVMFEFFTWCFGKFDKVISIWISMKFCALILVYFGFKTWADNRNYYHTKNWDYFWLVSYITYLCAFFFFPAMAVIRHQLPPASSTVVMFEQVRMIMKAHAFIRHNGGKIFHQTPEKPYMCPDISKYLYFLFAPTLVYSNNYPRTSHIRWGFVFNNLCQTFICVLYIYFVLIHYLRIFKTIGTEEATLQTYILGIAGSMLPGVIFFLSGFFGLSHAWSNAFAEMLRFADRQFYKDWWNSTSYSNYYKTWNLVVQDWLYSYVYRDISQLAPKIRFLPLLTVFTLSSFIHDYVNGVIFKFYLPVIWLMFGIFGMAFVFIPLLGSHYYPTFFFWFSFINGFGIMISIHTMEWYARQNCPPYSDTIIDAFVPRMWMCYHQATSK